MNKNYILISLVTHTKPNRESYGRNILNLFYEHYPLLAPQFANYYEPVNIPISNVQQALKYWEGEPGLYRRKNTVRGEWYISEDGDKIFCPSFRYNWNSTIDWFKLLKQLGIISNAYYAYIHVVTNNEREGSGLGSAVHLFLNGVTGYYLKKGIPQLGWGHYFGEEYVKELDIPLIKQHGFNIEPLGEGYVFNLTDQLSDVITNYDYFNERRTLLKSLFRPSLFQNYAKYEHES